MRTSGPRRVGMPSTTPSGSRCCSPPCADVDLAVLLRGADEPIAEAELLAERRGLRARDDEGVGPAVDHEAVAPLGLDVPAEARARFEQRDGDRRAGRVCALREQPVARPRGR